MKERGGGLIVRGEKEGREERGDGKKGKGIPSPQSQGE